MKLAIFLVALFVIAYVKADKLSPNNEQGENKRIKRDWGIGGGGIWWGDRGCTGACAIRRVGEWCNNKDKPEIRCDEKCDSYFWKYASYGDKRTRCLDCKQYNGRVPSYRNGWGRTISMC